MHPGPDHQAVGFSRWYSALLVVLAVATLAVTLFSAMTGYGTLDRWQALSDWFGHRNSDAAIILIELRLPRALIGALTGFTLGLSGAAMQGFLRNPLAEPGLLGTSSTAALGAVVAFYSGWSSAFLLALPLGGIAGAMIATLMLIALSSRTNTTGLILVGIAISSFCGAMTALALNLAPNPYAALEIVFWLMGSLADRSLDHVWLALPFMLVGWGLILSTARSLDALTLGEQTATSLGIRLPVVRLRLISGAAISVGSAVSVTGSIGFIGLIVPHLMRPFVGHRPGDLLLASGFCGAILLTLADIVVRLLPVRPELKLGVMTALIGAPFLVYRLYRSRLGRG